MAKKLTQGRKGAKKRREDVMPANQQVIEFRLGGVVSLPAECENAQEKLLDAIVAVVEAMGGQAGGQIVRPC